MIINLSNISIINLDEINNHPERISKIKPFILIGKI